MRRWLVLACLGGLVVASAAGGAVAYHTFTLRGGDRVLVYDLDLSCAYSSQLRLFACARNSTTNGPFVRITPTQIRIVSTGQRVLYTQRR